MKNDFDYIKEKFDNDNLYAPGSISENEILSRLGDRKKLRLYQKKSFKAFVSAAACFALVVGILSFAAPQDKEPINSEIANNSPVASFESYAAIKKEIQKNQNAYDIFMNYGTVNDAKESATDTAVTGMPSHSSTYVQVDGVDEADIIKNDGKYIYYANNNQIKIYEGDRLISCIDDIIDEQQTDASDEFLYGQSDYIDSIYIREDRLVINVNSYDYDDNDSKSFAKCYIYDLSDITAPSLIESFEQSGSCLTSRMIGSQLYMISRNYIYQCKDIEDCYITTCKGEEKCTLPASSIYHGDSSDDNNFIVISSIDIESCQRSAEPKAFYGCGTDVYCNTKNLYLTLFGVNETEIIKAELDDGNINFTAKGKVNGYIHNQFSMDERDGYFRIATTDNKANNLYVLDENLNKIGEVTGFAEGESIESVKFIGSMAYVITFEQTDPLFVIDLSDPASPIIKGSVEITGFSSQLVSVDENTLLGIGYSDEWGIKFALFDISNASNPTVLDSLVVKNADSNAQNNHKAIVVNREKGYFAMDYNEYDDNGGISGGLVIEVRDNKITLTDKYQIDSSDYAFSQRVTYIGDTIYVLDSEGDIYSYTR